jgi:hypothetical protein
MADSSGVTGRHDTLHLQKMMEVGRLESSQADEAHFGLWVITSSREHHSHGHFCRSRLSVPADYSQQRAFVCHGVSALILGMNMLDASTMERVWPIITNRE